MYVVYGGRYTRTGLVLMVLEEAQARYELREVDVVAVEHLSPDYLSLNPAGYVPCLLTPEGVALHETPAIMLYLAERHALDRLVPAPGDAMRGAFLSGFFFLADDIQPEIKRFYFPQRYSPDSKLASAVHRQAAGMLMERFSVIETRLSDERAYYLSDRFSLIDLTLAFWATSFHPQHALLEACPKLHAHTERVIAENACAHHIVSHRTSSFDYWQRHLRINEHLDSSDSGP